MSDQSPALGGQKAPQPSSAPRLGGEAAITHIMEALADESSVIRRRAVDALAEIGSDEALAILMDALHDKNNSVVRRAIDALRKYGWAHTPPPALVTRLMEIWHTTPDQREWLAVVFGRMGDPRALDLLEHAPTLRLPIRQWAIAQIGWRSGDSAVRTRALGLLARLSESPPPGVWPPAGALAAAAHQVYANGAQGERLRAAKLLADLGDPTGADVLLGAFRIQMAERSNTARDLLARLGDERPLHLLAEHISGGEHDLLGILRRYLDEHPSPLSQEAQAALNTLIPQVVQALETKSLYWAEPGLAVLNAAASPEAGAVLHAWLDAQATALLGDFAASGDLTAFNPRDLYHLIKPEALDQLRHHPLIAAHAADALHAWLEAHPQDETSNVLLCMGYLADERSLPTLTRYAHHGPDAITTGTAIKALSYFDGTAAAIIQATAQMTNFGAAWSAARDALQRCAQRAPAATAEAIAAWHEKAPTELMVIIVGALRTVNHPAFAPHLVRLLAHPDALIRGNAAYALGFYPTTDPDLLRPLLEDHAPMGRPPDQPVPYRVRDAAAESLARLGHSPY